MEQPGFEGQPNSPGTLIEQAADILRRILGWVNENIFRV